MSTSVSSLTTNFFPSPQNGFTTTTSGSVSSGATSVGLNSVAGYSNGQVATFVIDPTNTNKKQTFTGVIDTSGLQVTSVVWTAGTNQSHTDGATVVDYITATHLQQMTKGILTHADQDGTLKAGAVDNVTVVASGILTADKNVPSANLETYRNEAFSDFIASGGVVAQSAGLVGTFSNIVYYIAGVRYTATSIANKNYTASKDTYVDINTSGTVTYVEVANGATVGMTLTANSVRVAKVVTNGSAITGVTQVGTDPLGNYIYITNPIINKNGAWITPSFQNSWVNYGSGFDGAAYMKDSLGFVHLKGMVKNGTSGAAIFTLPAGYRPSATLYFSAPNGGATPYVGIVSIDSSGVVRNDSGTNTYQSLSGVIFKAEA